MQLNVTWRQSNLIQSFTCKGNELIERDQQHISINFIDLPSLLIYNIVLY